MMNNGVSSLRREKSFRGGDWFVDGTRRKQLTGSQSQVAVSYRSSNVIRLQARVRRTLRQFHSLTSRSILLRDTGESGVVTGIYQSRRTSLAIALVYLLL
ncbi:hypothetical protein CLAIMM_08924 [Cladophialophora immunda]|nr:hypothetical protein CLAIMM_08924 [Cladophialophora immunda]